eukprot:scaffold5633_cov46-Attheya_sp.AAC.5
MTKGESRREAKRAAFEELLVAEDSDEEMDFRNEDSTMPSIVSDEDHPTTHPHLTVAAVAVQSLPSTTISNIPNNASKSAGGGPGMEQRTRLVLLHLMCCHALLSI